MKLPVEIPITLPEELTRLEWVEALTITTPEFLVLDPDVGMIATDDPGDRQIRATRTRFAIGGTAVGAHHDLGTVTVEAGQTPTTRIAYAIMFTPWIRS